MNSLDKLLAHLFTLHRNKIELSLGRIHRLLAALGSPEQRRHSGVDGASSGRKEFRQGLAGNGQLASIRR